MAESALATDDPRDMWPATRGDIAALREELAALREQLVGSRRLLLRPAEFAEAIGVSERKVYSLIKRGLTHIYVGSQPRIPAAEALEWLREHGSEVGG